MTRAAAGALLGQAPRRGSCLVVALALGFVACRSDERTARGVAERFLDTHYVHIDLLASRPYTSGLARHKIDEEIRLTAGQSIDTGTRMPRVHYQLLDERLRDTDTVSFAYEASIHVDEGDSFQRTIQLTVRRGADGWTVSNYQEY